MIILICRYLNPYLSDKDRYWSSSQWSRQCVECNVASELKHFNISAKVLWLPKILLTKHNGPKVCQEDIFKLLFNHHRCQYLFSNSCFNSGVPWSSASGVNLWTYFSWLYLPYTTDTIYVYGFLYDKASRTQITLVHLFEVQHTTSERSTSS